MDAKNSKQQKVSFKIYEPLLIAVKAEFDGLPISRDAFLSNLIKIECDYLVADLHGKMLSTEAKAFISKKLKGMEKKTAQVNVAIDIEVAARLNETVEKTNIVRDAFLNRILYFLLLTARLRNHLELPEELDQFQIISKRKSELRYETIPVSPIKWLAQVLADPFCYLREELSRHDEDGDKLYLIPMEEEFVGFTCYAEYAELPGTDIYKQKRDALSEALKHI